MAKEQDKYNDLNALEAALAALTPRADRLNRDRLMFLAGQASAGRPEENPAAAEPHAAVVLDAMRPSARSNSRLVRWGWPSAFAAMTALAASLFTAILLRPPRVVKRIVEVPQARPEARIRSDEIPPAGAEARPSLPRSDDRPGDWLAPLFAPFETRRVASYTPDAVSHLRLRDLAFSQGLDAWPQPAAAGISAAGSSREYTATRRELMDQLLENPQTQRRDDAGFSSESTFPPGAKS